MTMNSWVAPDDSDLRDALNGGRGPIVVFDPCGEFWTQFCQENRWRPWRAWRLTPGLSGEFDCWDVLSELKGVNSAAGCAVLAAALFPEAHNTELTRKLMGYVLAFADDSRHFSGLPELAGQLWADDLWTAIARWSRIYPLHPALQSARALLTREGAGEAILAIRYRMMIYHHPNVAETFDSDVGFSLSQLRLQPGQILFLTPGISCLEDPDLMAVYAFITEALRELSALHHQPFTVFHPARPPEGDMS